MRYLIAILMVVISTASFADPIVYNENKLAIQVTADHPQFVIKLKSNKTTGYSWFLVKYDSALVEPVKHIYQAPTSQLVGAPGYDVWTFNMKPAAFIVPQQTAIAFTYARPWESKAAATQLSFIVTTSSN